MINCNRVNSEKLDTHPRNSETFYSHPMRSICIPCILFASDAFYSHPVRLIRIRCEYGVTPVFYSHPKIHRVSPNMGYKCKSRAPKCIGDLARCDLVYRLMRLPACPMQMQ
jgi:hypothetical protein